MVIFMEVGKKGTFPNRKVCGAHRTHYTPLFSPALFAAVRDFRPLNDLCHGVSLHHVCMQERHKCVEKCKEKMGVGI